MENVEFLQFAEIELDEAFEYYNQQLQGLGEEFLSQALEPIERIRLYSGAWQKLTERTRSCLMHRFPYCIVNQRIGINVPRVNK